MPVICQGRGVLDIAATGRHNLLMVGSPGSGKTLLARAMPGILPELSLEEVLGGHVYLFSGRCPSARDDGSHASLPFAASHHQPRRVGRGRQLAAPRGNLHGT